METWLLLLFFRWHPDPGGRLERERRPAHRLEEGGAGGQSERALVGEQIISEVATIFTHDLFLLLLGVLAPEAGRKWVVAAHGIEWWRQSVRIIHVIDELGFWAATWPQSAEQRLRERGQDSVHHVGRSFQTVDLARAERQEAAGLFSGLLARVCRRCQQPRELLLGRLLLLVRARGRHQKGVLGEIIDLLAWV